MVVEFARELSKTNTVNVYASCNGMRYTSVYDGFVVNYYDRKYLQINNLQGVLIAFKDATALTLHGFDQRFLWTADPEKLDSVQRQLCQGLFAIGPWHQQELKSLNIGYNKISYIEPGIPLETSKVKRIPKQCLYASSPDRGLSFLELIWPEILEAHPDATLVTTYSDSHRKTNQEMVDLYHQSDILAFPCLGAERYCITAMKAQMYGTIPCVIPNMALQDTVQFGEKALKKDYLHTIIEMLNDKQREKTRKDMVANVKYNTWPDVVAHWRKIIDRSN